MIFICFDWIQIFREIASLSFQVSWGDQRLVSFRCIPVYCILILRCLSGFLVVALSFYVYIETLEWTEWNNAFRWLFGRLLLSTTEFRRVFYDFGVSKKFSAIIGVLVMNSPLWLFLLRAHTVTISVLFGSFVFLVHSNGIYELLLYPKIAIDFKSFYLLSIFVHWCKCFKSHRYYTTLDRSR